MMKKEFVNKNICFLGDSLIQHGHFLYYLRSYFHDTKENCNVFNRGTGGNRVIMSQYILDREIDKMDVDYVFVTFGVNDLGIWLYDSLKEENEELLGKRKARDDEYFLGWRIILNMIKERGITPIIMAPCAVDQFIVEREDIETLADNKEKEDYIGPSFYKRKTFENINCALMGYAKKLKEIAEEMGLMYIPMFEELYKAHLQIQGVFAKDGIHLTKEVGHTLLAKIILEFLGCENIPESFSTCEENDKIHELEQIERDVDRFYTGHPYNPIFGEKTEADRENGARKGLKSTVDWVRRASENYLNYREKQDELRAEIFKLTKEFNK